MDKIKNFINTTPTAKHWEEVGVRHHHGICMPLFSLHSSKSSGIGEFNDLYLMIDWCRETGMDVLQLLPINECHFHDPSPYNALSSCALDYIYISLRDLPYVKQDLALQDLLKNFDKFKVYGHINYPKIRRAKLNFLKTYFDKYFCKFEKEKSFKNFIDQNDWVKEYAAYKILKKINGRKAWLEWEIKTEPEKLFHEHKEKLHFNCFLQYLAYSQMIKVKEYADKQDILLKGDIPLSLSPDSADVYFHREIFDLNYVIGVPPDDICPFGDKWGFYLFNWEKLKQTNFKWWRRRLSLISKLYHLYRIDHAVGFFRLWAIPPLESSSHGQFIPKDPSKWENMGRENLNMFISASPLLPLAEDLGLIPPFVYTVLKELGICGTKVIRWQKKDPKNFEPVSLTTVSTHDTETLTQWWQNKDSETAKFAALWGMPYKAEFSNELRKKLLIQAHHSSSLFHINLLPEYLAFFEELIHTDPDDERINIAGTTSPANWSYRLVKPLDELVQHEGLKKMIKEILKTPTEKI